MPDRPGAGLAAPAPAARPPRRTASAMFAVARAWLARLPVTSA
ncbi:MAG TPA: hypothetical protein VKV38_15970 [Trebonia sp.]|nr:hypothetical protein [Trebonia sp.]